MAPSAHGKDFETLSKGAYLDILLPQSKNFDAAALVRAGQPEELARAPTRRNLFFDEKIPVVLILRTDASSDMLERGLQNLSIDLVAHATDAAPSGAGSAGAATGKHDIASKHINATEGATVLELGDQTYAIWKTTIHLTRPRARLHRPAVYFAATLGPSPAPITTSSERASSILPPYQALPRNVLESLSHAAEFQDKQVYLSEDRMTKVAPAAAAKKDSIKPIRGATKRAYPTVSALFTRIKYSSLPGRMMASLQLETSSAIAGTIDVNHVNVDIAGKDSRLPSVKSGKAVSCLTEAGLPLKFGPGDEQVLLYEISDSSEGDVLAVDAQAIAYLEQGSEIELAISWQAKIDANPILDEITYQWSRPTTTETTETTQQPVRTTSLPAHTKEAKAMHDSDPGMTFFFTAPATVHRGQLFEIEVKCINRSTKPRCFSIQPVRQKLAALSLLTSAATNGEDKVAGSHDPPLRDERKVADVYYHNTQVKMGPIQSNASCDVQLKLTPSVLGLLDLGRLGIVDVDSDQIVELRDLPDVICFERDTVNY
ncbi:hypothetical protein LTR62_008337 [Meristemomyces frigidus]|uniref:Trafficking protein particle complex II-specific subunit 65 IgD3 domain-containing protein n=1 Tax=Meristemomyces frigidus TaxID=1508187 RepID=A0AAN7YCS4_9PEZI|nr:hypothetical protein LTR62_008337 [Meristemomyces frigidus]